MKSRKLLLLSVLVSMVVFSGCSLMRIASQPFKNTVSKVPQSVEKSERKVKCKGQILLNLDGSLIGCSEQYSSEEKNFTQKERKLNLREKFSQLILNVKGYLIWMVIIGVVMSLTGTGWVFGAFLSTIRGTSRVAKDLVRGISNGKRYVRQNGNNYSDKEREIYRRGADDMMKSISGSVSSKESKKIVNKLRAETGD